MRLTFFQSILLLVSLSFCAKIEAQIIPPSEQAATKDSIIYIVPEQVDADLNMIKSPEGFIPSEAFNGYINLQASSAIMMILIKNVNYINICQGMKEDFFLKNKLTLISDESIVSDFGVKGHKYKFAFVLNEVNFIRYMVYSGDLNQTLWLNITYPLQMEELIESEILKSIQSINLNPTRDEEK